MNLIKEIIDILSYGNPNLTDALIKTKVLLHKLGEKQLVAWVNHELDGYGEDTDLPDYRVVCSMVKANVMNMEYSANNIDVPVYHIEDQIRKSLEHSKFCLGIAAIEDLVRSTENSVRRPISHLLYSLLNEELSSGYQVQSAWCEIPKYSLVQILTQVRSRLLDFLLDLSEKIPDTTEDSNLRKLSKEVGTESLFNKTVFGNNTTIIVGDNNKQDINISIIKNDFGTLASFLKSHSVSDDDISNLKTSLSQDEGLKNDNSHEYGPHVKVWIKNMLGKAVEGTWNVGTGASGSLLATALNSFYGWF